MIPATIEDVTPEFLTGIFGVKIESIETNQIGQGVGLMGDIYRMGLTSFDANQSVPSSVVVKLPSAFEANRAQGVALGMFEAEIKFYNELAPSVPVGVPKIYHTDINPGTAEFVIVMEDLSRYDLVAQVDGMSAGQAHAAVEVLAKIHAVWWDKVKTPDLEWIPSMISTRIEYVDQLLTQIYPQFAEGFGQYLPPGGLELYQKFAGNYLNINKTISARSPWTLAHQDYRVENLLFAPGEAVVLDWQGIGRGPGAYDLAYLLSGSMTIDSRREHEAALVHTYCVSLEAAGIAGYSEESAWDDYGFAQLMGGLAVAMVTAGTLDLSNERGIQLVAIMAERHVQAALDHDGPARLAEILKNNQE
jgi:hypothetical protein